MWHRDGFGEGSPKPHNPFRNRTHRTSASASGIGGEGGPKGLPKNHFTDPTKSSITNHSKDKMNQMHLNIQKGGADLLRINPALHSPHVHSGACEKHGGALNPSWAIGGEHEGQNSVHKLLKVCKELIPFHDPYIYTIKAEETKSVANYKTLAFPDYWGHVPPHSKEPLLGRWCGGQR